MTASRTEEDLEGELWRCVQECKTLGYNPSFFVQMLDDRGGLSTAKKLISDDGPSDGFTKLWKLKRLDLTVKAVARRPPYSARSSPAERTKARKRLEDYGYRL